ncbi:TolC family protein [Paucibacter sp. R3-3]|uniref:TolC family protein n=1 Tax=Roseateles agri TaxID=3098619 RepID=A0ABU5DCI8_9BURK|nr:TolC family protein [Paucibacter sp. R3-3]MDY0744002.1 TolC family protein [Paucibacter sp. R3-3]
MAFATTSSAQSRDNELRRVQERSQVGVDCDVETGGSIDLFKALRLSLCRNGVLAGKKAAIDSALSELELSKAEAYPILKASAQYNDGKRWTEISDIPEFSNIHKTNGPGMSVNLSWTAYDFGHQKAGQKAAAAKLDGSRFDYQSALLSNFKKLSGDYFKLYSEILATDYLRELVSLAESTLKMATSRSKAGTATLVEKIAAEAGLIRAKSTFDSANLSVRFSRSRLASSLGIGADFKLATNLQSLLSEGDIDRFLLQFGPENEVYRHPDYLSAKSATEAARARYEQIRSEAYPTVAVNSALNYNGQPITSNPGSPPLSGKIYEWSVQLQISVPIFDRGENARLSKALAELNKAMAAEDEVKQALIEAAVSAAEDLREAAHEKSVSSQMLEQMKKSLEAAEERYRNGLGSVSEFNTAQDAYISAARQMVNSQANLPDKYMKYCLQIGYLPADL